MYNIRENLQLLWDFCIVAEELSISSAADKIYTSQSNLSKRMLNVKAIIEKEKGIEGEVFVDMDLNNSYPTFRQKV